MFIHCLFREESNCILGVLTELSWTDGLGGSTLIGSQQGLVLFGECICDEAYLD